MHVDKDDDGLVGVDEVRAMTTIWARRV
jgi:hypothetical protein